MSDSPQLNPPPQSNPDLQLYNLEDEGLDLNYYLGLLFENKWLIILLTSIAALLGGVIATFSTPVYQADALLQMEDRGSGLSALEDVSGIFERATPMNAEMEILKSRMVLGKVVRNLKLDLKAEPKYFPRVGKGMARVFKPEDGRVAKAWFKLPEYAWGGEEIKLESLEVPENLLNRSLILVAGEKGNYNLYYPDGRLLLTGRVGEKAQKASADSDEVSIFISLLKSRPGTHFKVARKSQLSAIGELKNRFSVREQGRQSAMLVLTLTGFDKNAITKKLNEIANIYVRQNVEWRSEEAERTLIFLMDQLKPLKEKVETAEMLYNDYRLKKGSVDLKHETSTLLGSIVSVEGQIGDLQQKWLEQRQKFKPVHPMMQAIDGKIARLKAKLVLLEKEVEKLPEKQQEILKLARDVKVHTELYRSLLNTAQELRIAKAGTVGNVRIIDNAVASPGPIKPKKNRIIVISSTLGLVLALLFVFVKLKLKSGVEDPEEAEKQLNIPVFASVPHSEQQEKLDRTGKKKDRKAVLLADHAHEDPAIESLRSLRTTLHFRLIDAPNNILLITGPSPNVGKTFISVNLATVLALSPQKVLVVDCDLRKGVLHRQFNLPRSPGLSELIAGKTDLEQAVHKTDIENLFVIASGKLPPNPAELLLNESFGKYLKELSATYDFLIIDAPPVLAVTDAAILGREAGTTLVLARAGQHTMHELEHTIKRLQHAGVEVRGLIFNDMALYSNRYGYGYRYGYKRYTYQYSYKQKKTFGIFSRS